MPRKKRQTDLIKIVNDMGVDIDKIVINRKNDRYLEGIVLTYSFIENILKYSVFLNRSWDQNGIDVDCGISLEQNREHYQKIQKECSRYTFYQSQEKAHELVLIDDKLYSEINDVREERNDMVHQFWLYAHRKNTKVLERKLKRLVRISKKLIKVFEKISRNIGIDAIFDVSLFFNSGKTHKN
jgi:hypothetical protein